MTSSIDLPSHGTPSRAGKWRGELFPLVAKSLIVSAFVCALLAAIGWALKLNSTHLTISFCLGGGISFVGGLIALALSSPHQKKDVLSQSASRFKASQSNSESNELNAQASNLPPSNLVLKTAPKSRKKTRSIGTSLERGSPEAPKEASISLRILETFLNKRVKKGGDDFKDNRLQAKEAILECDKNHNPHLSLWGLKIKDLPTNIFDFYWLEGLDISGNQIEAIPDKVSQLVKLKKLSAVSCVHLSSIPITIGSCNQLTKLDVSSSGIEGLPNEIGQLCKLKELLAEGCPNLKSIPNTIGSCTELTKLDVSSSGIEELPDSIGQLCNLKELYAAFCPNLKSIPTTVGGCIRLTQLNVSKSKIINLPDSIGKLVNLKHLFARNCSMLNSIPSSIGLCANLEWLDVSGSQIKGLPDSIGQLRKLKELCVEDCSLLNLESIPASPARISS